jgi:hypothetical protein
MVPTVSGWLRHPNATPRSTELLLGRLHRGLGGNPHQLSRGAGQEAQSFGTKRAPHRRRPGQGGVLDGDGPRMLGEDERRASWRQITLDLGVTAERLDGCATGWAPIFDALLALPAALQAARSTASARHRRFAAADVSSH